MTIEPKDFTRPEKPRYLYWTTPLDATLAEVHPVLMATLLMQQHRDRLAIKSCQVFCAESGCPRGNFDVAIDPSTGSAWGYFDKGNTDRPMERPIASS